MSAHSPVAATGWTGEAVIGRQFDDFYRAEFASLVVLATGVLGRRSGAEDLVQEAMLEAYRRWDRVGAYDAPRAWLRKVIVQRVVKLHRKGTNERTAHLRAVAGVDEHERRTEELDPVLREQLQGLPAQQRAVLALHYLEDCPISEIAEALGIAEGTVKVHLSRGGSVWPARSLVTSRRIRDERARRPRNPAELRGDPAFGGSDGRRRIRLG